MLKEVVFRGCESIPRIEDAIRHAMKRVERQVSRFDPESSFLRVVLAAQGRQVRHKASVRLSIRGATLNSSEERPDAVDIELSSEAILAPVIETLRVNSEERRKTDERYDVYRKLLRRMKTLSESREVPLNIDKRRKMAVAEKELADLQEELSPTREDESDETKKDMDVVLDEALKILSDFSTFPEARLAPTSAAAAKDDKKSWPAMIEQMLRNL